MSRIHEALERAAAAAATDRRGFRFAPEAPLPPADTLVFDHFPPERTREPEMDRFAPADRRHADLPELVIPERPRPDDTSGGAKPVLESRLVMSRAALPVSLEHYRTLAAALQDMQHRSAWAGPAGEERGLKALLVTSARPREGKTLTAVNLALTLSESFERRVLLIDADVRHPSLHEMLSLPNTTGLGDVLRSDAAAVSFHRVSPLLSVLPAGNTNGHPTALLASDAMRAFLHECASRFDWILVDGPPVGVRSDARLLARLTRAVLLVIGSGSTPYQAVTRAVAEIGRDCIVGTVLNQAEEATIPARAD